MSEWNQVVLDDVSSKIGDGLHGTPTYDDKGLYSFINGNNLLNGRIVIKPETKRITEEEYLKIVKPLDDSTILISINGTIGNVAKYRDELCALGKSACYINLDTNLVDRDFFYYECLSDNFQSHLENVATGTTIPNVPLKGIRAYKFNLPSLPEQKAIASVLSSLDDKIDLLHRQNKTLEAMAETLFRHWFMEEAKEDWEEKPLSSIATFTNGLACQKYPPQPNEPKLPVLKIKDLTSGISDSSDWATANVDPKYIVNHGDVIFAWSASLMVKIWFGETCVLNQHLFNVTSDEYPKWFFYQWCKYHLEEFISISQSHATTMGHIKRKDLDEAIVKVPSQSELQEMTSSFEPLMDKLITNLKQIQTLENLRDTLLPKLMSGEVRVQYQTEEVA
ncbi:restriction endonuclease subunit S [Acinetobacter haemolyticus]|uniref:restriction endonuclease subunit S n=1 Tax=Acinetobacter haemolyticus TaxID=29430 RepID=UPI00094942D3|nr:restriction endonuclease subunit S [Acinetobacter haemolyticus]APR72079.1 hypothetical protein AHTJS_17235 [Acinetobacter haemolyticus]